ncbi:Holliday junction resolvase RecU [Vaginisenegalia massiliensis]|uniref:Holliday junction resolvase RecU n=1 Tax=Vaginisenegalia massiliensis TaxID=2058294 RepID=UPI000F52A41E|nr:Holliday junction resolvase RecU [Vaginisenegalia massiliensis]
MIKYPSGQGPKSLNQSPNKPNQKNILYGSRGMSLEERLNQSNDYYRLHHVAVIHKKPTPIQVVKVDYPNRQAAKITEAYYRQASTTDYNGIYQGYYIDFEAKETKNKTSFPLANLPEHQRQHMQECLVQGGLCFLILAFSQLNEIYLLPFEHLLTFIEQEQKNSIPYAFIKSKGYLCPQAYQPMVDYIAAIDAYLVDNHDRFVLRGRN